MTGVMPRMAIVDYGMGNLFSVRHAFAAVGQDAEITASPADVAAADAIVIPGVGAFGVAMDVLTRTGLADAIMDRSSRGAPIVGICLGMQLMMSVSAEFGSHTGLGIVQGETVSLKDVAGIDPSARVPHVGWTDVHPARPWDGTPLSTTEPDSPMYFVHSYCVRPSDAAVSLAWSEYAGATFCSSLVTDQVFGCQFHPERSAAEGIEIYRRIVSAIRARQPFGDMA
jgi:glutamine amidotransferase